MACLPLRCFWSLQNQNQNKGRRGRRSATRLGGCPQADERGRSADEPDAMYDPIDPVASWMNRRSLRSGTGSDNVRW